MTFSGSIVKRSFLRLSHRAPSVASCRSPRPAPAAARPPVAATRCRTVASTIYRLIQSQYAVSVRLLVYQLSTINYLEPHHLPNLIQQLELRIGRDQVPAPNHGRQTATLVLTLPIPHHKLLTHANGLGRQVNSMFLG